MYALGIDIGGTFTDIVLRSDRPESFSHKELTTTENPSEGVIAGVRRLIETHDIRPGQISRTVHATTLFTNALIERAGAPTGLITTEGFRDTLEIGRERKYDLYDVKMRRPEQLIPREYRREVAQRMDERGQILTPLDEDAVRREVSELAKAGISSVAIVFLHAYANPEHERRAAEIVAETIPEMQVTTSHEIASEIREYERTSTTAINAYIKPLAARYLDDIRARFSELGIGGPFHLMLSNGGLGTVDDAKRAPVKLLESGPAAGALSAAHTGMADSLSEIVAFDMGGTTAKLCLIEGSEPSVAFSFEAARADRFAEGSGLPVLIPTVDLIEIGAGGGSIARRDELGLMKVGPRSAGSLPGPAAYGLGGTKATVTDADFSLGFLDPDNFAAGTVPIDMAACKDALRALGEETALTPEAVSFGIYDIVNEAMAGAARVHFAERGVDPRRFTLIATGGAGPVHAFAVAQKLGLRSLLCPPSAGVASAMGLLVAPARADRALTVGIRTDIDPLDDLEATFQRLERETRAVIEETGLTERGVEIRRYADGRFVGQGFSMTVRLSGHLINVADLDGSRKLLIDAFRDAYADKFAHAPPDMPIEFINIRVSAIAAGEAAFSQQDDTQGSATEPKGTRRLALGSAGAPVEAFVYDRAALVPGMSFEGPAVIEDAGSTFLIGLGGHGRVTPSGSILVDLGEASKETQA
ncbi:hydantoinase/oxoprolinase family protein [Roseovarius sp.]|uniref:hydantoinase/oxoprolinase family protein n=1 Tax=Roseovarius sp. TaxID=1486281 RepID=UPI003569026F